MDIFSEPSRTINGRVNETLQKQLEYSKRNHAYWQNALKESEAALEEARQVVEKYRAQVKAYASDVERTGKLIEMIKREDADNAS
ncbi:hypothetical protein C8J25_101858 [Sphingomonas faeni]|uniref:Uncharacterized protein n=1 Tax=Sphingomonas faeni TaxID=185950 RepID=A0A2T5UCX1_9SPHN|nr:hypothetical protein [Sphingomonas faeni]PTW49350.1 hypothetical protein C8J25_101858 [Sphingomonas faeni]